jgi:hypothetical protein
MLQNMGAVISTALSLMIVTSVLPAPLKKAIYSGAGANLVKDDSNLIVTGYRIAFLIMVFLTLFAIASSYLRNTAKESGGLKHSNEW